MTGEQLTQWSPIEPVKTASGLDMRAHRWLVRLCPEALRQEYGAAMEETIASRLAAAHSVGRWRVAKVWGREIAGLLTLAITERWGGAGLPTVSPKPSAKAELVLPRPSTKAERERQRLLAAPKAGIMDTITQELRHAARRLVRTPVFTAAAATTLALAIAANAAIFTLVYRVVLNPLPYADSGRLIFLDYGIPGRNVPSGVPTMTWQLYHQLADNARTLDSIAAYAGSSGTLTGSGTPERLVIARGTPSLMSVLRTTPALGRWFTEQEGVPGTLAVAVLTHGFWVRRFGADPAVVGRSILIDGVPTDVVGIMPASFTFPRPQFDLWQPAQSTRASASFLFSIQGIARLRDDATVTSAPLAGGRVIETLLYNVSPRDPVVIGAVTLLLTAVAIVACWLPARRVAHGLICPTVTNRNGRPCRWRRRQIRPTARTRHR